MQWVILVLLFFVVVFVLKLDAAARKRVDEQMQNLLTERLSLDEMTHRTTVFWHYMNSHGTNLIWFDPPSGKPTVFYFREPNGEFWRRM